MFDEKYHVSFVGNLITFSLSGERVLKNQLTLAS